MKRILIKTILVVVLLIGSLGFALYADIFWDIERAGEAVNTNRIINEYWTEHKARCHTTKPKPEDCNCERFKRKPASE